MTREVLLDFYFCACAACNRKPDKPGAEAWWRILKEKSSEQIKAALDAWWRDTTPVDLFGQPVPRGSTMPTPTQILAAINAEEEKQRERNSECARRERDIEHFWRIAQERLDQFGEWRVEGVLYRSLEEINAAPGYYQGTMPEVKHA